jgi:beta-glucosidase
MRTIFLLASFLLSGLSAVLSQQAFPYRNKSLPVETRVNDLLNRMSPEEKFWQLFMIPGDLDQAERGQYKNGLFGFQVSAANRGDAGGQMLSYNTNEQALTLAKKINRIQRFFVDSTRLGIPIIPFDEALHGLVRDGATAFPQAIALAASWDTTLMNQVAAAIATETKQRGIRQILSPVVNLASDVRWGRTEETYGEDPVLSAAMGIAFVRAFEERGIITTPKHFVSNVGDGGRDSYPVHINERLLEELYFPPFKKAIQLGGSRSLMTAYNSLNGTAASSNHWLLTEKLKKQWGFTGFVISDANAVGGEVVLHNTAKDYPASGLHAINAGLDVIFQTEYKHHQLFIPPFLDGSIDSNRINDAVSRVLKAKFELGLFENPYVEEAIKPLPEHSLLARQAASESIVLLKNEKRTLPFSSSIKRIAIIGTDADEARLGGYSGPGNKVVSILQGLQELKGKNNIIYHPGVGRKSDEYMVIPGSQLISEGKTGLNAAYYNNVSFTGKPFLSRQDPSIDFHWTLFGPATGMDAGFYSVRWTGQLISPVSGTYKIGLEGNDGYRLYINDQLLVDHWSKQSYRTILANYVFEKGKRYNIRVEFYEPRGNASIKLVWTIGVNYNWKQKIKEAQLAASKADALVIVAGITEGEFQDRAFLSLPGHQEELISAMAATGKPVVVLLVGGSAITMSNWMNKVQAIATIWYPGEQGGHAVADMLFGKSNPAGRLPITWPQHESQLPLVYNHKPTGRGDDYNNLSGQPLFPFGFGLSYTSFSFSNPYLSSDTIRSTDNTLFRCSIRNTGSVDGAEVVQLYIRDVLSTVARPVIELKGFQRIFLKAGEEKTIEFRITTEMLSMLNGKMETVVEPGTFELMIGSSSADIRLKEKLLVQ